LGLPRTQIDLGTNITLPPPEHCGATKVKFVMSKVFKKLSSKSSFGARAQKN
jgi:hypothetical protein